MSIVEIGLMFVVCNEVYKLGGSPSKVTSLPPGYTPMTREQYKIYKRLTKESYQKYKERERLAKQQLKAQNKGKEWWRLW